MNYQEKLHKAILFSPDQITELLKELKEAERSFMKNRLKLDDLEAMLSDINSKLNPSSRMVLVEGTLQNPEFGFTYCSTCFSNFPSVGYCLAYQQDHGHKSTELMPVREMARYLQGVLDFIQPD